MKLMSDLSITMALREKSKQQTKKEIGLGFDKQMWEILLSFLVSNKLRGSGVTIRHVTLSPNTPNPFWGDLCSWTCTGIRTGVWGLGLGHDNSCVFKR